MLLSEIKHRVAASAGAACHSDRTELSATLEAMNVPMEWAQGTLRFSTGKFTTERDIDNAVAVIADAVHKLTPSG